MRENVNEYFIRIAFENIQKLHLSTLENARYEKADIFRKIIELKCVPIC